MRRMLHYPTQHSVQVFVSQNLLAGANTFHLGRRMAPRKAATLLPGIPERQLTAILPPKGDSRRPEVERQQARIRTLRVALIASGISALAGAALSATIFMAASDRPSAAAVRQLPPSAPSAVVAPQVAAAAPIAPPAAPAPTLELDTELRGKPLPPSSQPVVPPEVLGRVIASAAANPTVSAPSPVPTRAEPARLAVKLPTQLPGGSRAAAVTQPEAPPSPTDLAGARLPFDATASASTPPAPSPSPAPLPNVRVVDFYNGAVLLTNPVNRMPQVYRVGEPLAAGETVQAIDPKAGTVTTSRRVLRIE
jgi:hypothetical protein